MVDATLLGPEESPYDGGAFHLEITIPSNYPLVAPSVVQDASRNGIGAFRHEDLPPAGG